MGCEVVFVDDGSTDDSFAVLEELATRDAASRWSACAATSARRPRSRPASTGASGEVIATMDGDLQNDPADIPAPDRQAERGLRCGPRPAGERQDNFVIRKLPSMDGQLVDPQGDGHRRSRIWDVRCGSCAATLAETLPLYGEMHRFVAVLLQQSGPARSGPRQSSSRTAGKTKYSLTRTVRVMLDLITIKFLGRYVTRPMHVLGLAGAGVHGAGGVIAAGTVGMKWYRRQVVHDRQSTVAAQRPAGAGRDAIRLDRSARRTADAHLFREPGKDTLCGADDCAIWARRRQSTGRREAAGGGIVH